MSVQDRRQISVVLTAEHLRLIVEHHLLKPDDLSDEAKLTSLVQSLVDKEVGYPDAPWHQWDDWAKGLE